MKIEQLAVMALRVFLVVLFAVLLLFQVMSLPGQFRYMAEQDPDMAYLRWPLTAITIFWVLCIQVVVVSTWKLLTLVQKDRIFSKGALVWVDVILGAIVAAWAVLGGASLYVAFTADDPGVPLLIFLFDVIVTVAGLLMVVMRALLRRATDLRTDMDAVI